MTCLRSLVCFFLLSGISGVPLYGQSAPGGFAIRGVLPWHNFLSGPSAWNLSDYEKYLDDCKSKKINFIGFHNYTGGGQRYVTYVEPMIRIAWKNILPEAYLDNSLTARWGYEPLAVRDFAFGTAALYRSSTAAFGSDCSVLSIEKADSYRRTQDMMKKVMAMAQARGMQTAMGFEFGVHPPEFFSLMEEGAYWEGTGSMIANPAHYQSVEILYATIDNILETYPGVDWIWLWLNEHSFFGFDEDVAFTNPAFKALYEKNNMLFDGPGVSIRQKLTGVWALQYVRLAYEHLRKVAPQKNLLIGGWGGSNQLPVILKGLDKGLPQDIVFSCLNPGLGELPQPEFIAAIAAHRKFWSIPWLEGDHQLWHAQPRVKVMREQVQQARTMKHDGVIAIHWRTEETKLNFEAFARFASDPADTASVRDVYRAFLLRECGPRAARELTEQFTLFDEEGWLRRTGSPEYYMYTPEWGRLDSVTRVKIEGLISHIEEVRSQTADTLHRSNLAWCAADLRFTLLLDVVGRKLEPAYQLRKQFAVIGVRERGGTVIALRSAQKSLDEAPLEELFRVYASRVRSRGELGVLSSLNQKLFNEYNDLKRFLSRSLSAEVRP
jgi:hypothetical protein